MLWWPPWRCDSHALSHSSFSDPRHFFFSPTCSPGCRQMNSKWPMWGWTLWKQTTKIRYLLSSLFHLVVPWIQFIRGNEIHIVSLELDPAATSLPPPNLGWFVFCFCFGFFFFLPSFLSFLFFSFYFPNFLFQPLQKRSCLMLSAPLEVRLPFKAYHIKACYWFKQCFFPRKSLGNWKFWKKCLYISALAGAPPVQIITVCSGKGKNFFWNFQREENPVDTKTAQKK